MEGQGGGEPERKKTTGQKPSCEAGRHSLDLFRLRPARATNACGQTLRRSYVGVEFVALVQRFCKICRTLRVTLTNWLVAAPTERPCLRAWEYTVSQPSKSSSTTF